MNIDKVEIARELLRELNIVTEQLNWSGGGNTFHFDLNSDIDEDLIINAMIVYLDRINKLKTEG